MDAAYILSFNRVAGELQQAVNLLRNRKIKERERKGSLPMYETTVDDVLKEAEKLLPEGFPQSEAKRFRKLVLWLAEGDDEDEG